MTTHQTENYNPANLLRENAARFPDKPAIHYPDKVVSGKVLYKHITFAELEEASDKAAYALQAAGFGPGNKTVFMVKVGPELFIQVFALFKVGAIPVIVDPGMGIKRMLHCFKRVGAQTFMGVPIATFVRLLARRTFSSIRSSVTIVNGKIFGQTRLLKNTKHHLPYPIYQSKADKPALITFTTGSTGPAKAVECTQIMAHAMMTEMKNLAEMTDDDIQLLTLPFFGVTGMMMGTTCVLAEMDPTKPADIVPPYLIQAINDFKASVMFGSPSLLHALGRYCTENAILLKSLRMVNCGGAPMTLGIMRSFRAALDKDAVFETTWGATEGLPLTSINIDVLLGDLKAKMDEGYGVCIGKPVGNVQVQAIKIIDGPIESWSDALVVQGQEIGELVVFGDNISPRYHNDAVSDKKHKILASEGIWHRTGDLGWVDEEGRVWFCGRRTHQVKLMSPELTLCSVQCEGVTNAHPDVYRSALVCVHKDDPKRRAAAMCIELNPGITATEHARIKKELLALLKAHDVTKPISHLLFHPSFPVDIRHNAKIERHELGEWATENL